MNTLQNLSDVFFKNLTPDNTSDGIKSNDLTCLENALKNFLNTGTKEELIDYAVRSGLPLEVIENLEEIEDEGDIYETIEDVWPDYPSKDDFLFNEDEY